MVLDDVRKFFLRSRWISLALVLELLALANDHLADLQPLLGDRYWRIASFVLPVLIAVLRFQSASQQPLSLKPVPKEPTP